MNWSELSVICIRFPAGATIRIYIVCVFPARRFTLHINATDTRHALTLVDGPQARASIRAMSYRQKVPLASKFPNASPQALDLLKRLLVFNPAGHPSLHQLNSSTLKLQSLETTDPERIEQRSSCYSPPLGRAMHCGRGPGAPVLSGVSQ